MIYKLPDGLVGEQILLRYRYVTANSCLPPGYEGRVSSIMRVFLSFLHIALIHLLR